MRLPALPTIATLPTLARRASGGGAALPTLVVSGGTITLFSRSGVDYVEVLFSASGNFTLSADIAWHNRALGAGGGNGGRVGSTTGPIPAGGGAGGLLRTIGDALLAGTYGVNIGAGAPANSSSGAGSNGSDSKLIMPSLAELVAYGGGKGASSGVGSSEGAQGGSGGGGRGATGGVNGPAGAGTDGQGYSGGLGFSVSDATRASGGGGGAGGPGGNAGANTAGTAGPGLLLDWIATPRTVCRGGPGSLSTQTANTAGETWGNGSQGTQTATVGKGGDGFFFLVVSADQVNVVAA